MAWMLLKQKNISNLEIKLKSKQNNFDLALSFKQAAVQDLFQTETEEIKEKLYWYLEVNKYSVNAIAQYKTTAHIYYLLSLSTLQESTTAIHLTSQQSMQIFELNTCWHVSNPENNSSRELKAVDYWVMDQQKCFQSWQTCDFPSFVAGDWKDYLAG